MDGTIDEHLDLQQAADALGVHYQTAYRWVRGGRLPAAVVAGKYVVDRADVVAFARERSAPHPPASPRPARLTRAAERVHDALVAGDEAAVSKEVVRLAEQGAPIADLVQDVLVPALRRIGQAWHEGKLTIWVEHRASAIVERVLGSVAPNPRGRRRGTAMVAALTGDLHSLPTTMAAVALRDDHWHVHHLGADMPPDEIVEFCDHHDVTVAVLTVTTAAVASLAAATADRLRAAGTPTVVGGPGRTLAELIEQTRRAAG